MVRVVFLHPDLGIGGAERLIVDAALALKRKGHQVTVFTSHHDHSHCFPETVDGQLEVHCAGDWLPRSTFGKLYALWAYVRMVYLALYLVLFSRLEYEVAFVDQVAACIPFLRLRWGTKVVFYCHFPDLLLAMGGEERVGKMARRMAKEGVGEKQTEGEETGIRKRKRQTEDEEETNKEEKKENEEEEDCKRKKSPKSSQLRKSYRFILDKVEEWTTGQADCVLVNSHFTAGVFKETFKSLKVTPQVVYPSLDFEKFKPFESLSLEDVGLDSILPSLPSDPIIFLSLNRFERKKNLPLALEALKVLLEGDTEGQKDQEGDDLPPLSEITPLDPDVSSRILLVVAGGYDHRVQENVQHLQELESCASRLGISDRVAFLRSPPEPQKAVLLRMARGLLYTPEAEHFGIVPLEAMAVGTPVLAAAGGGPRETVVHGATGFLLPPREARGFARAMGVLARDPKKGRDMGARGKERVLAEFSSQKFEEELDRVVRGAWEGEK
ncbi:alpha-1,3/1,6-mannosyltransferase ALG2-like [Penaeus japonicus]|uniref:alpha-1,3/1,6-mannosyltransferase ALG2-like n=1 Tax=Penaeus japonicus TaxID=27405 RepID=UPI001C70F366|nr:alpha-1,3/1,6-mannosyltransferase ALG2-like [Penaeus japonicus]